MDTECMSQKYEDQICFVDRPTLDQIGEIAMRMAMNAAPSDDDPLKRSARAQLHYVALLEVAYRRVLERDPELCSQPQRR